MALKQALTVNPHPVGGGFFLLGALFFHNQKKVSHGTVLEIYNDRTYFRKEGDVWREMQLEDGAPTPADVATTVRAFKAYVDYLKTTQDVPKKPLDVWLKDLSPEENKKLTQPQLKPVPRPTSRRSFF